jgi:hypothetical protein
MGRRPNCVVSANDGSMFFVIVNPQDLPVYWRLFFCFFNRKGCNLKNIRIFGVNIKQLCYQ